MKKLNFRQKVVLTIFGNVYLEQRKKPGWRGPLPFYAFKCREHGIVEDYPHGFRQELSCPKCQEERVRKPVPATPIIENGTIILHETSTTKDVSYVG